MDHGLAIYGHAPLVSICHITNRAASCREIGSILTIDPPVRLTVHGHNWPNRIGEAVDACERSDMPQFHPRELTMFQPDVGNLLEIIG
jgi:hypothetical protein